jgi:hypothetical protein
MATGQRVIELLAGGLTLQHPAPTDCADRSGGGHSPDPGGQAGSSLSMEMGRYAEQMTAAVVEAVGQLVAVGVIDAERSAAFTTALRGLIVIHMMDYLYRGGDLEPGLARRIIGDLSDTERTRMTPGTPFICVSIGKLTRSSTSGGA